MNLCRFFEYSKDMTDNSLMVSLNRRMKSETSNKILLKKHNDFHIDKYRNKYRLLIVQS